MAGWSRVWVLGGIVLTVGLAVACAGTSWEATRSKDTVAAYHQFLRDHPESNHVPEAQERLAYLRVSSANTIEAFQEFEATYPESELLVELREKIEPLYFNQARKENTALAYRTFLARYATGAFTRRALGNLFYVESVRQEPTPGALRRFLDEHAESDFRGEAELTLRLFDQKHATSIRRLAVRVDVAPNVVQPERVRSGFTAVVARAYAQVGVEVTTIPPGEAPPTNADAWMRLDYHEAPAAGVLGSRTLVSHCRVRLYHKDSEEPIWDQTFETPADHLLKGAYGRDKTVFGNSGYTFWEEFFVPISSWATSSTRVKDLSYLENVTAIDVEGDRAAVLYERGGIDVMDVSSSLDPQVLARYRRERDLTRWVGVEMLPGSRVLIYGPDGLELVDLSKTPPQRQLRFESPEIGGVHSVDLWGQTLLVAGTRGVYAIRLGNEAPSPHRLLDGEYVAIAVRRPNVFLVSPTAVEVTTPKHLMRSVTGAQASLGKHFGARSARIAGDSLFVFGKEKVIEVSLANPDRPTKVGELDPERMGNILDVAAGRGNLYVLSDRGLQVTGPGSQLADQIQVEATQAVARKDRYLFLVGERRLEILDVGPYLGSVPAAPVR